MNKQEDSIWQCPYAKVYCYKVCDCGLCWNYLSLEIYGIERILEELNASI